MFVYGDFSTKGLLAGVLFAGRYAPAFEDRSPPDRGFMQVTGGAMPRAYSQDLRGAVIETIKAGAF
jgi:hypothetical protein